MIERIFYGEFDGHKRGEMFEQKMTSLYIGVIAFLIIVGLVLAFVYRLVNIK